MFEALPEALLEIHTGMMASAILSDTIPCERLKLDENPKPLVEDVDVEPTEPKSEPKPNPTVSVKPTVQSATVPVTKRKVVNVEQMA